MRDTFMKTDYSYECRLFDIMLPGDSALLKFKNYAKHNYNYHFSRKGISIAGSQWILMRLHKW